MFPKIPQDLNRWGKEAEARVEKADENTKAVSRAMVSVIKSRRAGNNSGRNATTDINANSIEGNTANAVLLNESMADLEKLNAAAGGRGIPFSGDSAARAKRGEEIRLHKD